jgi:hypothetical protein
MLNRLTRYAPLTAELDLDESGALRESVLDVGCGPDGLAIRYDPGLADHAAAEWAHPRWPRRRR